jgi:hypothetical protein
VIFGAFISIPVGLVILILPEDYLPANFNFNIILWTVGYFGASYYLYSLMDKVVIDMNHIGYTDKIRNYVFFINSSIYAILSYKMTQINK